ncbi:sensor histidine kinase [Paenibacillus tyrfis]|uniref:sensor histidine kinase n=1 Tax=Paenibacillus tyrfis TaxID=1501230 RepID=UPI00068E48F9|nr:HAMP domain-containing sensor histidine kinase [Paenibacillus tyrfis]
MMLWPKAWRVAAFALSIVFFWSIGFAVASGLESSYAKRHTLERMLESGAATIALMAKDPARADDVLRQLALLLPARVVLVEADGRHIAYGEQAEPFSGEIGREAASKVFNGGTLRSFERLSVLGPGEATTGQLYSANGREAALFIRTETPSLLLHYGWQLFALLVGGLLQVAALLAFIRLGRTSRREFFHLMVGTLNRMAKGDFNIKLDADPKRIGPYEPLASGINRMAGELGQIERMRQEFIANVSHEIQSPLTSISGFSRELQNDNVSKEERIEILGIIETESRRLSKLSDNLLKLTSLESDHHPFEPKRYRLDNQLRKIVLACEPQWVAKNLEMDVELDYVTVTADEDTMSQVWLNLLNNDIKFTPEGGVIAIRLQQLDGHAVVTVRDNGCGIAEEDLPFVFDRFFKADKSRSRLSGGSGLGLSIVKKIVDMHQGTITVHSEPGKGATFTVSLPLS